MSGGEGAQGRIRRPSPATVISLLALFVALAGTAYALERGEVKSKHIAADAVRAKHVTDEVTGDAGQIGAASSAVYLSDCDIVHGEISSITLKRPARILAFASATATGNDPDTELDAQVELRQDATTVATTPHFTTPVIEDNDQATYNVTAVLRDGSNNAEIPAGTYSLRTVVDVLPCSGSGVGITPERLGYLVIGAR